MYAVAINEINLACDGRTERQRWALSRSLSLFPGVTLSLVTCSLLCLGHAQRLQECSGGRLGVFRCAQRCLGSGEPNL